MPFSLAPLAAAILIPAVVSAPAAASPAAAARGAATVVAANAAAPAATMVAIPGGTPVDVHLVNELSSRDAHAGDKFAFTVQNDVRQDGWLVIGAGAQGVGEIDTVDGAAGNGHAGKLGMKFDYVYAVDGEKVKLSSVDGSNSGEEKKGASSTATIASYALLGPLGFFAHNFVHGHDATIPPTKVMTVFVDETVHVAGTHQTPGGSDFAH